MSDDDEDFRTMAITTRDVLKEDQPLWEPLYAKMTPNYAALDGALTGLDNLTGRTGGGSRMKAEQQALDAAMPVVNGIRAVQLDTPDDTLKGLAKLNRTTLDNLRDTAQVNKMRDLLKAANGIKTALADERVTQTHLDTLAEKTEALAKLTGAPRKQVITDSQVTAKETELIDQVRAAIKALDTRVPNLKGDLPDVVARYQKARKLIKLGGRSKKDKPKE